MASAGTDPIIVSEYQILTLEFLQQDEQLNAVNSAIHGDIFCEILTNHSFTWMFLQTSNTTLCHSVALSWYQMELQSRAAQLALPPLLTASSSLFSVLSLPLTAPVSTFDSSILLYNSLTHSPALFDNQPAAGSPIYNNHMSFPLVTPSSSSLSHPTSKGMMSTFEDVNHLAQPVDMGHTGGIETNTTYIQEQPVTFEHSNTMSGMDLSMNVYDVYNNFL